MPPKGTQPKCECGHANIKHHHLIIDEFGVTRERGKCRVKDCNCKKFLSSNKLYTKEEK